MKSSEFSEEFPRIFRGYSEETQNLVSSEFPRNIPTEFRGNINPLEYSDGIPLQENTPNSDGHQCRRTFVTDYRPISDEIQKIEVVGIPSAISDGIPTKQGSSEFSDDFSTTFR
ncbi:hypothetical protein F2Q68_00016689 [Brassica cretica]|uniref:Uncharacterized protein n=1 Tax=Brassica cretica TaxID=69181 RepID=A0A8S9HEU3_BRACR|nr:hypothetical protein F2Q68_00016689 [Brassica cretica]